MTSPSPDANPSLSADLALMIEAARAAGAAIRQRFGRRVETWSKGAAGPVTEADLAANAILLDRLRSARPDYGWLSEETPDDEDRLTRRRVFVVDPLDGTVSFLKGIDEFCVAIAVVEGGHAVAGVVYNPIRDEMFEAGLGLGARRNGAPMQASRRLDLEDALLIGPAGLYTDHRWREPWPPVRSRKIGAMTYRLAMIASGEADGMVAFGFKSEWDIAAGAILVAEAGAVLTDPWGAALTFNQPDPRGPGAVAAGPGLHPLLIERTRFSPRPETLSGLAGA